MLPCWEGFDLDTAIKGFCGVGVIATARLALGREVAEVGLISDVLQAWTLSLLLALLPSADPHSSSFPLAF